MKNSGFWFLLVIFMVAVLNAQGFRDTYNYPNQSEMMGGLGITWIDDEPYTTLTIAPELALGKVGFGFYLQLLMDNNNNFKLRKDEYQGGAGLLRAVRYVRYGNKFDPFYARAGTLILSSLGNGFLMWNYTNASNYDQRKWGLAFDVDFGKFGFESVVNNLGRLELIGGNLYFRPFRFINKDAPILKNFRLYGTYVYDDKFPSWETQGERTQLSAYGLGADIILLDLPVFRTGVYYDYGKFMDFGYGQAVGINAIFPELIGLFGLSAKFEKRWLEDQFIASFFGPQYELDRELDPFEYPTESGIRLLENATKNEGYFGQLAGHIINKVRLVGNYQRLNGVKGSGVLHMEAMAPDLVPKFELKAFYDKRGIETFEDFRTLDNRSLVAVDVGYRLNMFLVLSTVYYWSWVKVEDENGNIIYRPQERIEPRLSFSYRF
ncbi:MAG: hypothetical protein A2Y94_08265 [Caldithrix sp. RBG_13_44_9]|nr:MAG: hypothetical protein A2Y94_08265 [Caldithrix sp. RBG_13_44_9]